MKSFNEWMEKNYVRYVKNINFDKFEKIILDFETKYEI